MTDCTKCMWCVQPYCYYPIICFRTTKAKEYYGNEPKYCKHFQPYVEQQEQTTKQKPWQIIYGGKNKAR